MGTHIPTALAGRGLAVLFVVAGLVGSACITEPPDYPPVIQNQLEVPVQVYQFPSSEPESLSLLVEIDPWDTYEPETRNCVEHGLVAFAEGVELARIDVDAEEAFCSNRVWKLRADGRTTLLDNRPDRRP
jgi:hypothetical protein